MQDTWDPIVKNETVKKPESKQGDPSLEDRLKWRYSV